VVRGISSPVKRQSSRHERAFLRKRFVKHCTSRFRGNVVDVAPDGMAIRCDALSRHDSPRE
jgi:hypothetical protein